MNHNNISPIHPHTIDPSFAISAPKGPRLIGTSSSFQNLVSQLRRVSKARAPIHICGETGTGKELAARSCHYFSTRRDQEFIAVNCANFPDHLIESELFGYKKGAFTDAKTDTIGLVQKAEGGTLFLDEINSLSHRGQAALLRFLQDFSYRPVGGKDELKANISIITASNVDLENCVHNAEFRSDLYYRLNVASVYLPPLRERTSDIEALALHFIEKLNLIYDGEEKSLSREVIAWMKKQKWPGNIRQLENWIHREYLLTEESMICTTNSDVKIASNSSNDRFHAAHSSYDDAEFEKPFSIAKKRIIEDFEKNYLKEVLTKTNWNITHAAKIACKERRNFSRLVKKYGLEKQDG